ncbi:MAG: hypothetical protein NC122_10685 [Faecalibacterium sp.]|nr:hypothetical protein [Ruminococcus sp.]MCM1393184.1 hypothetical protein [Ruminococcus sp.]MCM1486656.1 hypothetical protein [Faecalibacterium sp.]
MKKIIRVFPHRNSYTPDDDYAFIGMPPLPIFIPEHDEIHVSCTFTWDKKLCEELAYQWEGQTNKPVKLGGVAYGSEVKGFEQGMYMKKNIIFTTRGCNNNCPWCCVPKNEGKLVELPICQGNIIQDNNFLQASKHHKDTVFEMLKTQRGICFKGGLEPDLIDSHFCESLAALGTHKVKELWLACDTDARLPDFKKACEKLQKVGFNRNKIHCYVLSYGKNRDKDEARAREVYEAGAMPFVQLYRDFSDTKTEYSADWNKWARMWQRPAATRAHMEKGTDYDDFDT